MTSQTGWSLEMERSTRCTPPPLITVFWARKVKLANQIDHNWGKNPTNRGRDSRVSKPKDSCWTFSQPCSLTNHTASSSHSQPILIKAPPVTITKTRWPSQPISSNQSKSWIRIGLTVLSSPFMMAMEDTGVPTFSKKTCTSLSSISNVFRPIQKKH